MFVRYKQEIAHLRIALAVVGLNEFAKVRPSFEDLMKFFIAGEKEHQESSEVGEYN